MKFTKKMSRSLFRRYDNFIEKRDKNLFSYFFNIRSEFLKLGIRVQWNGNNFTVTDKNFPSFNYKIRHQKQCNLAYKNGILQRANDLSEVYFLNKINFHHGDVFIDCGANVGDLKLWFDLNSIDINYVGFEPSPIEFRLLERNIQPSMVHNIGLWNNKGNLDFFVSSQGADSSLIEPPEYDEKISVSVDCLESTIKGKVKCLKLEAEGAEPEILEGVGTKLEKIEFISADLGFERGKKSESTLIPVTNYLLDKNFELIDIRHGRISALYRNKSYS